MTKNTYGNSTATESSNISTMPSYHTSNALLACSRVETNMNIFQDKLTTSYQPVIKTVTKPVTTINLHPEDATSLAQKARNKIIKKYIHISDQENVRTKTRAGDLFLSISNVLS